ncbi:MAG: sigma 54-interacting transcriptional regulator [Planctomycetales bacterium]|nr:sigma 54-interacting transcriptional regulator [Planctomycetales bacterium]
MSKIKLSNPDRTFFQLVADATFTNPFSAERAEIDRRISGISAPSDRKQQVSYAVEVVRERLGTLDLQGPCRFQDFDARDTLLMRYTFLFEVYHAYAPAFDAFIQKQQAAASPLKVPFAAEAIHALIRRGFNESESVFYFSMFYQIRRAFYFIDRGLVGKSDCMRKLRMDLWNNIFTWDIRDYEQYLWDKMEDFSTLLEGPTGSGKGAAAAAIGRSGYIPFDPAKQQFEASFTSTFIPINLSQFAETLLESELFGHTKGAFTGAVSAHQGVLSLCGRYGSIFLDEIGEISIPAQVKLLKVLEERMFSPVGSHEQLRFDGRVIAATNQPVHQLRREGKFRADFYYRLCSDCIQVPPLSQRVEENPQELAELVEHFTQQITGRTNPELVGRIVDIIEHRLGRSYPWPGNVRELAQCIRRIILKRHYEGHVSMDAAEEPDALTADIKRGALSADQVLDAYCRMLYQRLGTYEETARITGLDRRTVKKRVNGKTS